ncbi:MAG: cache domain-containing protein [Alphaproteobacteria bacterium]|nr:cache domain-containing protein [Alphaproteobacteria bacterium]
MTSSSSRIAGAVLAGAAAAIAITLLLGPLLNGANRVEQSAALADYMAERAEAQYGLFDALITSHQAGVAHFTRLHTEMDQVQIDTLFERWFPHHPAGARRGSDPYFDGFVAADGTLTYGMGAFLGGPDHDAAARRVSVAGFETVRSLGPAFRSQFDNFYFNDDRRLMIFAPERPDRLAFYRHKAPASFSFARHDFVRIVQPAANPLGRTACTALTDLLYAQDQRALTIGCHTPVRINGRHLGAFGTTLPVAGFLRDAVDDPSGRESFVVSREGRVVGHPALFEGGVITDEDVAEVARSLNLEELVSAIVANGRTHGVIPDIASGGLAAFAKLEAPGWYLVIREPAAPSPWRAWSLAVLIGLLAGALVGFQLMVLPRRAAAFRTATSRV